MEHNVYTARSVIKWMFGYLSRTAVGSLSPGWGLQVPVKPGGQGILAFGGGGAWRDYSNAAREESGKMLGCAATWPAGPWVFQHFHLANPGPFPTEERFSLKELIRRCFAPKWLF